MIKALAFSFPLQRNALVTGSSEPHSALLWLCTALLPTQGVLCSSQFWGAQYFLSWFSIDHLEAFSECQALHWELGTRREQSPCPCEVCSLWWWDSGRLRLFWFRWVFKGKNSVISIYTLRVALRFRYLWLGKWFRSYKQIWNAGELNQHSFYNRAADTK